MKIYDKDIRELLIKKIITKKEFILDPSCVIVPEMDVCFGCARIDIAVINGQIHGFEIKSECDNLERLPSQMKFYNKIFDTLTLVVSEKYFSKTINEIPEWWGLYCIKKSNKGASLEVVRSPKRNPEIDLLILTQMLWKIELLELLTNNGLIKGIKSKTRHQLGTIAVELINNTEIASFVREKLKSRKSWRALELRQLCDDLHLLQPN